MIKSTIKTLIYEEHDGQIHGNQKYVTILMRSNETSISFWLLLAHKRALYDQLQDVKFKIITLKSTRLFLKTYLIYRALRQIKPNIILVNNIKSFIPVILPSIICRIPVVWYIKNYKRMPIRDFLCGIIAYKILAIATECLTIKGKTFNNLFTRKCRLLPIGIDLDVFNRPILFKPSNDITISMISRLSKNKGIDILLKAMNSIDLVNRKIYLNIVGGFYDKDAQFLNYCIQLSKRIENVVVSWAGWQKDVRSFLWKSDIIVLPSRSEGVPRSLVEAMAASRAVIASDVGGIKSLLINGYNGLIFPKDNWLSLSKCIEYLINNENIRKQMGENAKYYAFKYHNISVHIKLLEIELLLVVCCDN